MTEARLPTVEHVHWGRVGYREALQRQRDRWDAVREGTAPEAIFTLEHDPVFTLGRRGTEGDLRVPRDLLEAQGFDVVDADRGGEVTYHGPGQIVVYLILALRPRGLHAGDLVRGVAGGAQDLLAQHGVQAAYDNDAPGLWTDGAKIAAVGMRISRGVSMHGMAVNLTTDLSAFERIVPCGMPTARATSLAALQGEAPSVEAFASPLVDAIARRLSLDVSSS